MTYILFLFIFGSVALFGLTSPAWADDVTTASVGGKYHTLLKTLNIPDDRGRYGDFYDWGHWDGTSYAGFNNLPSGYWVYVYPNWYIWQGLSTGGGTTGGGNADKASVNGKYSNLLKVLNVPSDHGKYGDFSDWGYWAGSSYAGYNDLPYGYWVYVYPDWYIWGNVK